MQTSTRPTKIAELEEAKRVVQYYKDMVETRKWMRKAHKKEVEQKIKETERYILQLEQEIFSK